MGHLITCQQDMPPQTIIPLPHVVTVSQTKCQLVYNDNVTFRHYFKATGMSSLNNIIVIQFGTNYGVSKMLGIVVLTTRQICFIIWYNSHSPFVIIFRARMHPLLLWRLRFSFSLSGHIYRSPQLCWLMNLKCLEHCEHVVQSFLNTYLVDICW